MDTVLIIPPGGYYAERWQKGSLQPPLGVLYLASVLEKNNFSVGIIDAHLERFTYSDLAFKVSNLNPKIIGISFCTDNRFQAFKAIRELKNRLPDVPVVAGGPHPSLAAQDTLSNVSGIDFILRNEGEISFPELVQGILSGKNTDNIPGISYKNNGNIRHNPACNFVSNLDTIPFPARHLIQWKKYNFTMEVPGKGRLPAATILASRGCPFTCNFCSSSKMWGVKIRARSPANIIEEIQQLKENYNARAIWFLDDVFAINKQNAIALCDAITGAKINLPWLCEIRVDIADFDLLKTMKNAGCFCVGFGVESGSQRILDKVVHKRISIEKVKQVRDWCRELDLISNPFFIYSHPDETEDDLNMTLSLIKTWPKKSWIGMKLLHIYPGTEIEKIAREKGIIPRDFSWAKPLTKEVEALSSTQGDVPIFRDKLSWEQLGKAMFEWSRIQRYPILKKIPKVIKDIRSIKDFKRYLSIAKSYLSYKLNPYANQYPSRV